MDADGFDTVTRLLTTDRPRRRALTAVIGGALVLLGLAHPDAAAAKKPCPSCKKRK